MRFRLFAALAATTALSGHAVAYDATKASRYASPDMYRPNVDRVIINGSGSTGDVSAMSVLPQGAGSSMALSLLMRNVPQIAGGTINLLNGPALGSVVNGIFAPAGGRATTKNLFVATDGSDANDGLSPLSPKATLQAAVNAANPNGQVTVGSGVYTISSTLLMQPGVRLNCLPGAQIVRAAGASYATLIDFGTNAANAAGIDRCTINDNLAGNAYNINGFAINIADANDVRVTGNTVLNSIGYGIYARNGLRPVISGNAVTGAFVAPIAVIPSIASAPIYAQITDNRLTGAMGQHAIILNNADFSIVTRNQINSAPPQLTTVNTSGTTVTWASGNDFSGATPGQFITLNNGTEYLITAKASNTSLTVNTSPGTVSNASAVIGDGDLISVANLGHSLITNNTVTGGGAGGIVISNFIAGPGKVQDLGFNTVANNHVTLSAHSCISLQATTTSPATVVYDNTITGNLVNRCGIGKNAILAANRAGISVFDFTGTQGISRTTIAGNTTRDDLGNMLYGINLFGVSTGQVFAGNNAMSGAANPGIGGAISSVVLGSAWGTTASVSSIQSFGSSYSFTITSGGTGQAANPLITVNTPATTLDQPPVQACKMTAGSGSIAPIFGEQNANASQQVIAYSGTPTAGSTYTIVCR